MRIYFCGTAEWPASRFRGRIGRIDTLVEEVDVEDACDGLHHAHPELAGQVPIVLAPRADAAERIGRLRSKNPSSPILVIGADALNASRLLDAGADDVIRPDCGPDEFMARIRAACRKRALTEPESGVIRVGDLCYAPDVGSFSVDGVEINLTPTERSILSFLIGHAPKAVPRQALYDALYGLSSDPPQPKAVDLHIFKIRRKFEDQCKRLFDPITTCKGQGYRISLAG